MGVQDLWELLAPVGRRVSVETLAGKKLAIDASIWMVQFIKAMRDERGEMVRNAHLLGFFRRICKLLFLRTRPVFVFDGGTPALKRRTVAARRRHRENARAKIRKTAEKLLLNHLKAKKLEELAAEIKNSKPKDDPNGKCAVSNHGNDSSGDSIPVGTFENALGAISQEGLDEMLAASLAAEEEGKVVGNEPASTSEFPSEVEFDEDENEEMAIPVIDGNVDPTVLASLPPSMQLDLLVQMRERLMAENRQKYQKIKKSPLKFSELQIQSYLKTVAFRREIDEVQKFATGRGPEGVQTSRIASEANREFIFSSTFTGDKKVFTSAGVEKNGNAGNTEGSTVKESMSSDFVRDPSSSSQLKSTDRVNVDDPTKDFGHDIETYRDERGRIRVSRVRGMGIRMTRDLQRNLDLMRERGLGNNEIDVHKNMEPIRRKEALNIPHNYSKNGSPHLDRKDNEEPSKDVNRGHGTSMDKNQKDHSCEPSTSENETPIEVSFLVDDIVDRDDDLFSQLVAMQSSEVCSFGKGSNGCESDFDWEEGAIEKKVTSNSTHSHDISQASSEEKDASEDDGLIWEGELQSASACQTDHGKPVSKGSLEEEYEVQEAIRRSLEDLRQQSDTGPFLQAPAPENSAIDSFPTPLRYDSQGSPEQAATIVDELELLDGTVHNCSLNSIDSAEEQSSTSLSNDPECKLSMADVPSRSFLVSNHVIFTQSDTDDRIVKKPQTNKVSTTSLVEMHISRQESFLDTSTKDEDKASTSMLRDVSVPGSSDVCVVSTGKTEADLHGAHVTVLLDSHNIPEEEDYRRNTTNDSIGFDTEILESTLDAELLLLSRERRELGDEQRKLERNAETVNSEMFAECQELLQMFGLPYIIAPMEAEAQCAYMELMNLVDGVVTDDSDVFLFGAQNVYKNIFDDKKYVETYLMKDIENELGLPREKLIDMALLLGSDYTEGVSGIGIVNAIEVVHAFPEEDGLKKFREWVESPDPAILGKLYPHIGDGTKTRLSKANNTDADGLVSDTEGSSSNVTRGHDVQSSSNDILYVKRTFMDKHRNVSKNWHIPSSFPSESVVSAYTNPQVDESTEPFTSGKPDLPLLRKLCWEKFGWANQKADELLVPVLREYNKHETQLRLEAFYTFNEKFAKIRSQRIKRAVKGITGNSSSELMGDLELGDIEVKKKRQKSEVEQVRYGKHTDGKHDSREALQQLKETKPQKLLSGEGHEDSLVQDQVAVNEENESNVNGGRGRGRRGRGRKMRRARGRGREKENRSESRETSSSDTSYRSTEKEKQVEIACSSELRRSVRQRRHVQYAEEHMDSVDISDFLNNKTKISLDEPAATQETNDDSSIGVANDNRDLGTIGNICGSSGSKSSARGDYLFIGGGFCIDDGDLSCNPTRPISDSEKNPSDSLAETTGALGDQNMDTNCSFDGNLRNIQEPIQATPVRHEETDLTKQGGHQTDYGFTAMTSLRRKRK